MKNKNRSIRFQFHSRHLCFQVESFRVLLNHIQFQSTSGCIFLFEVAITDEIKIVFTLNLILSEARLRVADNLDERKYQCKIFKDCGLFFLQCVAYNFIQHIWWNEVRLKCVNKWRTLLYGRQNGHRILFPGQSWGKNMNNHSWLEDFGKQPNDHVVDALFVHFCVDFPR